ncbi:FAD-binding protein [Solihabitans fulvus]|uniref:FAD-binding protein n=1 Tax=Solihabitans fulvus TaxID=1892852 RepID=A0A5B2XE70_9PSEU|nr:FAD-binding protein [Solihabitans fulvus]KAA2261072.1 FAD-binding protein [Solihabitans fulvus]
MSASPRHARDHHPAWPRLDGRLDTDETSLRWAADDFGHLVHRRPRAVLRPGSVADIAAVLRHCATHDIPVAARAEGHSTGGQAQALDGVVIDLSGLRTVHEVGADFVSVDAGARWSQVLAETLPLGLTPPVLTDYLELSVGGTLSVGGLGGASHHHGAQTDNVLDLTVSTPDGELLDCSPTNNAALFNRIRAGRGRHGVILRATVRLVPAPTHARRHQLYYTDLAVFLDDQRRLVADGRFDYLEGQLKRDDRGDRRYLIEATTFRSRDGGDDVRLDDLRHERDTAEVEDLTYWDFLNRLADGEAHLRSTGEWLHAHPWSNLLLPDSAVETVLTGETARRSVDDVGPSGLVLLYPIPRQRLTTPMLDLPDGDPVFLFALLRHAATDDHATVRRMQDANRALRSQVTANGGTVYLVGPG